MDMFYEGFEKEIYEQQRRMDVRNRAIASLWQEYQDLCLFYDTASRWAEISSLFTEVEDERAAEERKGSMKLPERKVTL